MNLHQNSCFVNLMGLLFLCEKSGTILLVLVGLMANRQLGEILKFSADHIVMDFNEHAVLLVLRMHFNQYYCVKFFVRHVL